MGFDGRCEHAGPPLSTEPQRPMVAFFELIDTKPRAVRKRWKSLRIASKEWDRLTVDYNKRAIAAGVKKEHQIA